MPKPKADDRSAGSVVGRAIERWRPTGTLVSEAVRAFHRLTPERRAHCWVLLHAEAVVLSPDSRRLDLEHLCAQAPRVRRRHLWRTLRRLPDASAHRWAGSVGEALDEQVGSCPPTGASS